MKLDIKDAVYGLRTEVSGFEITVFDKIAVISKNGECIQVLTIVETPPLAEGVAELDFYPYPVRTVDSLFTVVMTGDRGLDNVSIMERFVEYATNEMKKDYFDVLLVHRNDVADRFGEVAYGLSDAQMERLAENITDTQILNEAFWDSLEFCAQHYLGLELKDEDEEEDDSE